jgi:hypothetical protein
MRWPPIDRGASTSLPPLVFRTASTILQRKVSLHPVPGDDLAHVEIEAGWTAAHLLYQTRLGIGVRRPTPSSYQHTSRGSRSICSRIGVSTTGAGDQQKPTVLAHVQHRIESARDCAGFVSPCHAVYVTGCKTSFCCWSVSRPRHQVLS